MRNRQPFAWRVAREAVSGGRKFDSIHTLLAQAARLVTRESVVAGLWREAVREGEGSSPTARVAALSKLGEILGISTQHVHHYHAMAWVKTLDVTEIDALLALPDDQLAAALEAKQLPAARDLPDEAPSVLP